MEISCPERSHLLRSYRQVQIELQKRPAELLKAALIPQNDTFERALAVCEAQRQLCSQVGEQITDHFKQHLEATRHAQSGAKS